MVVPEGRTGHRSGPQPGDPGTLAAPVATEELLLSDIEAFGDFPLFIGVMSCLRVKLLLLIADLDNALVAGHAMTMENISLPLPT